MGKASRRKHERREIAKRRAEFKRMPVEEANKLCSAYSRNKVVRTKCPRCDMDVFLHCGTCQIQITGCLCSAVERMTPEELGRFREELQKKKARNAGLILPEERN